MKRLVIAALYSLSSLMLNAQINGYAKVTAVSGNVLTLSNVNQTYGTFSAGLQIIVIQMQGATISNTTNSSSFGTLSSLNSAGLYEVATISAVNGGVTSLTLTQALNNSYSTAGSLQIVTYPQLGSGAYTTTANITPVSWNGNVGGVIAFRVNGNLILNHNISANSDGFRGGASAQNDGGGCETSTYITTTGNAKYADKGEGVYITAAGQKSGRAKAVNGGGGGIVHNGGGGGGGNYTAGGDGYYGYTGSGYCSSGTNAGGQGGLAVASSGTRVFLGGGGGGGQGNNSVPSAGAAGGGIVLIKCDTIVLSGACTGTPNIRANGASASASSGNDGAGGGGAGGSVVLLIKGIRVISTCSLVISANGGNGGDISNFESHGAGGGGGQGAIYISAAGPFTRTTLQTNNGTGGESNNGGSSPNAGSGGGTSGSGANTGVSVMALPVKLSDFSAEETEPRVVVLSWTTLSETNSKVFEVYHSVNGGNWKLIGEKAAAGESHSARNYSLTHRSATEGINYYRLKQIDQDGSYQFSDILYVDVRSEKSRLTIYPNPTQGRITVEAETEVGLSGIYVINAFGERLPIPSEKSSPFSYKFDFSAYQPGIYFLIGGGTSHKIILK